MAAQTTAQLPAERAARTQARRLLQRASAMSRRLLDPQDGEALHAFRVALRRLRSFVRAYEPYLPLGKKRRKALRRIARETAAARDAEVLLAWLEARRAELKPEERVGLETLVTYLRQTRDAAYARIRARLPARWARISEELRARLNSHRHDTPGIGPSFGAVSSLLVTQHCDELASGLGLLAASPEDDLAHRVRIRGKRLRYLLEPFGATINDARAAVTALKALQDDLGAWCDNRVLRDELVSAAQALSGQRAKALIALSFNVAPRLGKSSAGAPPDVLPGLIALARQAKAERECLISRLAEQHLGRPEVALAPVRQAAAALRATGAPSRSASRRRPARRRTSARARAGTSKQP